MKFRFLVFLFLFGACSAQQDRVTNHPPEFNSATSLETEYGRMVITDFSAFVWPDKATHEEAVALYDNVALYAAAADKLELRRQALEEELGSLDYSLCFKNFEQACVDVSTPEKQSACDDVTLNKDTVQTWIYKSADDIPAGLPGSEGLKKLFATCKSFPALKASISAEKDELITKNQEITTQILYAIDPDYEKTRIQTNYKSFKKSENSIIKISQGTNGDIAEIRLDGFIDSNIFQTNIAQKTVFTKHDDASGKDMSVPFSQADIHNVDYSHKNRTLNFVVPEFKDGALTGGTYLFFLERNNFGKNPRFSGELIYTDAKGVSHHGSAKIDGKFEAEKIAQ
jgi:hypothetical protein